MANSLWLAHQWSRMSSMDRADSASSWLRRSPSGSDVAICLTSAASARPETAVVQGQGTGSSLKRACQWLAADEGIGTGE